MQLDFLTPRVERLRSDGAFEAVHDGGALGRLRRPVVLLARDLCAFSLFEATALPAGRRRQAARLHARLASPYVTGGAALVKAGADFGVWWWDLHLVTPAIEARYGATPISLCPETLAQPTGGGWRIVRLQKGFEAQFWRDRGLIASAWRRDRFGDAAWAAFASLQRGAAPPPETPPAPEILPVAFDSEAFAFSRSEVSRDQAVAAAAGGFALAACSAAVFLLGQGLQLDGDARAIAAETAAIRRATPGGGAIQAMDSDRRLMADYREVEERTNPVSAAGAAIGIVAYHDLTPTALDAAGDVLTITLPYSAVEVSDALVAEFEESGYFFDVQPRTDATAQSLIIEMKVREAAPPLSADG